MSTQNQQAASRANGAKSQGPVTPEGKTRSSRNSLRHGLCSAEVVLPHENRAAFEAVRTSYLQRFDPADQPEADLVETLVSSRWRLNRVVGIENKIFEEEMVRHSPECEKEFFEIKENEKLAWCFDHMANHSKSLQLLIRYEGSLNRTYDRALKQLQTLQSTRPPAPASTVVSPPPTPQPNEPEPDPIPQPNEPAEPSNPPSSTLEAPSATPETPSAAPEPELPAPGDPPSAI